MHISISSLILIAIVIITIVVEESKIRKKSNALNTLVFKSKREVDKQMQANYHEEILHLDKELIKDRHSWANCKSQKSQNPRSFSSGIIKDFLKARPEP